jgi:rubrerythrin
MMTIGEMIADEKMANRQYRKAATLVHSKQNRRTYISMARDEARHRKMLVKMRMRIKVSGHKRRR